MAEYFATPNEVIDLGKNREWMEPSDERGTSHGRGQASTSRTWASGTRWEAGGATDGTRWRRHCICGASLLGSGPSRPRLNSWLPICRTLGGPRNKISDTRWKHPGRSRPRMGRPDRRQPASCKSSPWLWMNAQDLGNVTTHERCEPCLGPELNTWTTKRVLRQLEKFEYGVSVSRGVTNFVSHCAYTAKGPFLRNFSFWNSFRLTETFQGSVPIFPSPSFP